MKVNIFVLLRKHERCEKSITDTQRLVMIIFYIIINCYAKVKPTIVILLLEVKMLLSLKIL